MKTTQNNYMANTFEGIVNELFNGKIFAEGDNIAKNFYKYPPTNITETPTTFELEILAPGRAKEDIKISLEKNQLTIKYTAIEKQLPENTANIKTEFAIKSFSRIFNLSEKVDATNIAAKYNNGILQITLAKKEEVKTENTTIEIL